MCSWGACSEAAGSAGALGSTRVVGARTVVLGAPNARRAGPAFEAGRWPIVVPARASPSIGEGTASQARRRSWGSAASKASGAAVAGWANARRAACNACRSSPSAGRPPYSASASSGNPRQARCTRIWWVRPVCRRHSTALTPCAPPRRRTSVRAGLPPGTTAMRTRTTGSRPIGASIENGADASSPCTSARYSRRTSGGDRARQRRHRGQGLGDHHQARCVLVKPVHDARARQDQRAGVVRKQGIEQGAAPVPGEPPAPPACRVPAGDRLRTRRPAPSARAGTRGSRRWVAARSRRSARRAHAARPHVPRRHPPSRSRARSSPASGCARTRPACATSCLVEPGAVQRTHRSRSAASRRRARRVLPRKARPYNPRRSDPTLRPPCSVASRCTPPLAAALLAAAGCSSTPKEDPNSAQAVEKLYAEGKDELASRRL